MKKETAQIKFGDWLLAWGHACWDAQVYEHWKTNNVNYTDRYTTKEMFEFFKMGKKWMDK